MTLIKVQCLQDYKFNLRNIAILVFCRQPSGGKREHGGLSVGGFVGCLLGIPLNAAFTEELCININIVNQDSEPQ